MDIDEQRRQDNLVTVRQSDFSIDHILNRAGERSVVVNQRHHNFITQSQSNDGDNNVMLITQNGLSPLELRHCSPSMPFNWLQYTRYRPPKPQKSARHAPAKRTPGRLPRVPFSTHQLFALEEAYKQSSYLSAEEANRLAENLELTSTRVKIWFQNRRARERRERRESGPGTMSMSNAATDHHAARCPQYLDLTTSRNLQKGLTSAF